MFLDDPRNLHARAPVAVYLAFEKTIPAELID
jgi:hypothetical protein